MPGPDPGNGGRKRLPCQRCGSSRECDRSPEELRVVIDGEKVRVCEDCLEDAQDRGIHGGRQPDFRVPEDSPLAQRFAEIDRRLEQGGRA